MRYAPQQGCQVHGPPAAGSTHDGIQLCAVFGVTNRRRFNRHDSPPLSGGRGCLGQSQPAVFNTLRNKIDDLQCRAGLARPRAATKWWCGLPACTVQARCLHHQTSRAARKFALGRTYPVVVPSEPRQNPSCQPYKAPPNLLFRNLAVAIIISAGADRMVWQLYNKE